MLSNSSPLRVAVCGAGAFGGNHLRVYRELEQATGAVRLAAILESDAARAQALGDEWGVPVYTSLEAMLAARSRGDLALDAASVCVPTSLHHAVAAPLLHAGIDLLIEKPIAASEAEANELVDLAKRYGRVVQTGHLERFNPAILAVQPLLNQPMFFEAHRLSVFTPRALDVDVVLDLMIHDLDIVLSFAASPVQEIHAVGLPILSNKTDIANVRLEFESGCVANFTASRVSTEQVRKLRFFQPHQYISIDYARRDVLVIDVDARSGVAAPAHPSALPTGLAVNKPTVSQAEPLRLEIESFLDAVRTRSMPLVSAEDGRAALALALAINREIAAHAERAGLGRFGKG
ncbi:MAG TPA: Gfo/Idh/MocA family oxidoreductase [Acidobacteriaceae bacterium]|nr:Gfo/Idh/MocA family oxidoreductase [Acidobacteriaceae bacterium]